MPKKLPNAKVYIDGANMFYAQQKMGWFIDWQKVKSLLGKQYKIIGINCYTGIKKGDLGGQKFNNKLKSYGFKIIAKPLKKILLSKNNFIFKANFDVEIAVDLILEKDEFDYALLFSGDSDFDYVVKKLHKFDKKIFIYCSRRTLSNELRIVADKCYLFGELRTDIEYKK